MDNQSSDNSDKNGIQPKSGVDAILNERGSTYGDSGINLKAMHEFVDSYFKANQIARSSSGDDFRESLDRRPNQQAHDMAIVMIMAKLSRIATGRPHADNYDDLIGYAKIARQHAVGSRD